jgi:multiple sugar transport system permease protein
VAGNRHPTRNEQADRRFTIILIVPAVLVTALLLGYPMGYAVYLSTLRWNDKISPEHPFIGLENYRDLWTDQQFTDALNRTVYFSVATVFLGVAAALGIALLLNQEFPGRTIARVLLLVPWAVPPVVNGIMWKLIFDGEIGVLNYILRSLGLVDQNVQWLANPTYTMNVLIFAEIWKLLPFLCLIFLASLQSLPGNIMRAARIDGAGPWRRFIEIVLPHLKPTLMFAFIIQSMWSLKVFDTIYVLTGGSGGPAGATTTINFQAYLTTFSNLDRGYGAAMAVVIMLIVLIVAALWILLFNLPGRRERALEDA